MPAGETMQRQHDRDGRYDGAIRAKLGETLRERYDLVEPLEPRLLELLAQLDITVRLRETAKTKLYAEVARRVDGPSDCSDVSSFETL
jgi:hypothetical protein